MAWGQREIVFLNTTPPLLAQLRQIQGSEGAAQTLFADCSKKVLFSSAASVRNELNNIPHLTIQ